MTNVKKVVAMMLAFLMIFSSASVLASAWEASADDGFNLDIETKFFKQVDGEWVETTKVKPGDVVEARVYLGTDYYSNDSTLLFFYDKDFFTHSYSATPVRYAADTENTVINANNSFVTANGVTARVAANPSLTTQINNGYIDTAFTNDYAAISTVIEVNAAGESNVMYDGSDYILAFTLTVAADASGEGDFFVKDTTVQSAARKRGIVNVPKGPADGTDADIWAMRLWNANVTLNSQPVSTMSSVTFNANTGIFADGTDKYVAEGMIDSAIDASAIPAVTKDGYSFMGWIDAADATPTYEETISAPTTIPENDLVLNAYWMESVDITFNTDGGSTIPAITGAKPYDTFAKPANPTKDGYTFVGWDVRGNMDLPDTYPAVDTTYTAIWAKDVVVSFDTNGADAIAPINGVAGEDFTAKIDDPKKAGHYFIGWSPALPTVFPDQDTTYTANFEVYSYMVSYYVDGKLAAQTQVEYGMPIPTVVPLIEVATGKILDGWYTNEGMTDALAAGATMPEVAPGERYKLYAQTTNATYDAIFRVDGVEYARVSTEYEADIVAPGDEGSTIAAPAKEGYVFASWYPYPATMDQANDMYFDATWTEAMNQAVYVVDGSEYEVFDGIAYGMDLEVPADPDKEGYTFLGWADTADATAPIVLPEKMPADSVTYYAVFKINTYNVTFNTADGAFADGSKKLEVPYNYNADVEMPEEPTQIGYTFVGWVDDATGTEYAKNATLPKMIAKDVSYTAKYTINSYTATFVSEGTTVEEKDYEYKAAVAKPADPSKTGHTFVAWVGEDGTEYDKNTALPAMGAADVKYTAKFDINSYTVTFNTADGKFADGTTTYSKDYNYDAEVAMPAEPTQVGYTFVAWVDDATGTEYAKDANLPAMIDGDVSYTAKYEINTHTATFNTGDGKFADGTTTYSKDYNYNADVAMPEVPTQVGYTFVAWVDDATGAEYAKGATLPAMIDGDVSYTAKYTINSRTVTWVFDNGDEDQVDTYEYNKAVTMPTKPEKTGYTFTGWKYSETDVIYADGAAIPAMIDKNVTYTAQWQINTYTVTWIYNDDGITANVVKTYTYGADIEVPADPTTKVGHKFLAWSPAVDKTMPAYDLEYTATWEALPYNAIFDANDGAWKDGDTSKTVSTLYGQQIEKPAENPERAGYVFVTWEPEVGIMNNINGLTFTAKWAEATDTKYTVITHTMKADGSYEVSTATPTGTTNDPVDVTPTNVAPGFKFNEEKSNVTGNILADGTLELNVYIDRESYVFTVIAEGSEPVTTDYLYGATVVMPAKVDKVGYTFDGWYDGDTKYAAGASTTMPIGGLTVEAKWTANEVDYKVVVNYTDAATGVHADEYPLTGTADYTIVFVDEVPDPEAANTIYILKSDYAVNHYTLDEAASDLTGTVAPNGSTVLNLYYTPVKYVATFVTINAGETHDGAFADGSTSTTAELDYNTLVKPNAPANPIRTGYTFTGWSGLTDATRLTGNRTFYASYTPNPYQLTWVVDPDDADKTQTSTVNCDTPINAPAVNDSDKIGYKFLGWSETEGGTTPVTIPSTMPAGDRTYYAIWEIQQYTVTFYQDKDSTEVVYTTTADYGTEYTVPTTTKKGHAFANWVDTATDTVVTFGTTANIPAGDASYYATWTVNSYTATWVYDNGDANKVDTYAYDAPVTMPTKPVKAGYTFAGWKYSETDAIYADGAAIPAMTDANVTYTAQWTPNDYTITFDADNGTEATKVTQAYKTSVAAPAAPEKSGYSFGGWATTKGVTDPTQKVAFPVEMPIDGTTYYAIWVANNYTITFNSKDGTAVAPVTQAYGTSVAAPTAPTKEGYTFGGWSATDGGTAAVAFPVTMPVNGATYYAIWTIETYTVNWVSQGTTVKSESVAYNAALTAPETTRTGYKLEKWVDDKGNTAPANMTDIGDNGASVTYTAVWTAKQYNAIFNANGGAWADGATSKTVETAFDAAIVAPENPERAGYTFGGWNPTVGSMTEEGMTFNATWVADTDTKYTVETYTMNTEGTYDMTSEVEGAATDSKVNVKPSSVPAGFALNDTKSVYEGTVTADNKLVLKVYIDRVTYQFNTSTSENVSEKVGYLYGATVVVPAEETLTGYTFDGWYYNGTKYAAGATFTMPANDVTLTGSFNINSYKVTWVFDNGTTADKVDTYEYDKAVAMPTKPEKSGYTFAGWKYSETDAVYADGAAIPAMIAKNVTYTAQWDANEYSIVYDANGGAWGEGDAAEATKTVKADYLESVDVPANPARTGYTFAGWYSPVSKEEGGSKVDAPTTMPLDGMTLVADWTINSYTVTFYENDTKVKVLQQTNNQYGAGISAPTATMTGYTLDKWVDAATGTEYTAEQVNTLTTPANAVEFYATWKINSNTVNFRGNGGLYEDKSNNKAVTVTYGTAVAAPEIPVRAGYTFTGWMDNATKIVYDVDETLPVMIDAPVNYLAQWQQETYTISWISDNQAVTGDEFVTSAKHGDEIVSPEMSKKGYTFNGWSYNGTTIAANDLITIVDAGENGAAITITADWTANTYDAIFNANGGAWADGATSKTVETAFDAAIDTTTVGLTKDDAAAPTRAGYTFNGWEPAVGSMDEEGKTFTASWIANGGITYTVITYTMGTDGHYDAGVSKDYEGVTDATVNAKPATVADGFKLNDTKSVYEGQVKADGTLTLKVYIDRESYTVTTKVDGEVKSTATALYGATVTVPAEEVKEGYTFSGWSVNGTAYEANATFDMPAEAVEISGTFKVNQYDAKFYVDGALIATVPTNYGEVPVAPTATKTGYTFKEWSPALAAMTVNGAEYNAVFTANTTTPYTVEIYEMDLNGAYGEAIETLDFTGTSDTTATYVPETKEGFTAETVSGNINADGSLVLKVYYERQKYSVTYNVDGSEYNTKEYYYGADVDATLAEPTKTGYTFSGWDAAAPATMPAEDVVISGTFSINTYTITYMVDGAAHKVESYEYGKAIYGTLAEPEKTGYTFSGWDAAAPATMPAENLVISGTFSINTYTITYMVDGAQHKVESYEYGADVTALAEPEKTGYTFSGWDIDAPATMPANNLVISGTFSVNQYDATFYVDGKLVATVPTDFDKVPTAPDVSTLKPGYTFVEWNPALEAMTTAGKRYDAVYKAQDGITYKVETYKMATDGVTYELVNTEEFTGIAGDKATYGVKDYEGFTFVSGTNYDAEANTISGTINGNGSTVLEVRYSRNKITVNVNGEKDEYYYGEEIQEPTAPKEPEGMDHTGWVDEDGNVVEFPYTVPTDENDDIVITPVFTPINYKATFVSEGATVDTQTVAYGSAINAPADPAKEGYRFVGWADENGTFLKSGVTTMPAKDVTYTAVFEVTTSGVSYYVDGVLVGLVSCEYGDEISTTVPGYTVPTGYEFDGWYTDAACTAAFVEGTTYGTGVTALYAKTTAKKYNAVFNANGGQFADGTGTYTVSVDFESDITPPADPTREGYDFQGWDPLVGTMDEEGMTFNAIWTETVDGYTVTYYVQGEVYDAFDVALNADLEVPADPDVAGWKFLGWATTPDATAAETLPEKMPASNLTYYAVLERSSATISFYDYAALDASPWKSADATATTAEVNYGDTIEFPANNAIDSRYWTFLGWSTTENGEVIDTTAIEMAEGVATTYYAVYEKVAVKLVPVEGSTTMIERNGAIESYNDGYTVSTEFVETTDSTKNLIYGLRVGQRDTVLTTTYVEVLGDGYAVVTPVVKGRLGTGTLVEVYDRNGTDDTSDDGEPVETFYVVIFGDVDGNARLTIDDKKEISKEISNPSWSSVRTKVEYLFRAANLDGNRRLTLDDGALVSEAVAGAIIDQVTGKVS